MEKTKSEDRQCSACLKTIPDGTTWIFYSFKHLKAVFLCACCIPRWKEHMETLQEKGL